jgi:hypothetical protein
LIVVRMTAAAVPIQALGVINLDRAKVLVVTARSVARVKVVARLRGTQASREQTTVDHPTTGAGEMAMQLICPDEVGVHVPRQLDEFGIGPVESSKVVYDVVTGSWP